MIRANTLNVLSWIRSSELGDRIRPMLDAIDDLRVETRTGDLESVDGEFIAALERIDVLRVDSEAIY